MFSVLYTPPQYEWHCCRLSKGVFMVREGNPLRDWMPKHISNWPEWLAAWHNADLIEVRHGLLYLGLKVPLHIDKGGVDRLRFYLELADGSLEENAFCKPGVFIAKDYFRTQKTALGEFTDVALIRHNLANKAYDALAARVFKIGAMMYDWSDIMSRPAVVESLLWFFRRTPGDVSLWNITAHYGDKRSETVREFVEAFCEALWDQSRPFSGVFSPDMEIKLRKQWEANAKQNQTRAVEMLIGIGKVERLLDADRFPCSQVCLDVLQDTVMSREFSFNDNGTHKLSVNRKPRTVDEAVFKGSRVARVLKTLSVCQEQRVIFQNIDVAARESDAAAAKLTQAKAVTDHQRARAADGG